MMRKSIPSKEGNTTKGKWIASEDRKLKELVETYGSKKWGLIAKDLGRRQGKQCRERWYNHLCPNIKKDGWTEEEDQILIKSHKEVGTKWIKIAKQLPRRSPNTIKNHWNTTKRRTERKTDGEADPGDHNILENYIRSVTINKDDISKVIETDDNTANAKDDDVSPNMLYEEVSFNLNASTQTAKPLVDMPTTSAYVPVAETFAWDNYITELCDSVDYDQMLMDWRNTLP